MIKDAGGEGGYSNIYPKSFLIYFRTAFSFAGGNPVAESQSLTVLPPDADATSLSSGENAKPLTEPLWPSSVPRDAPVAESQSLTVLSSDADATSLPSGEKATSQTQPPWPLSVLAVFQNIGIPGSDVGNWITALDAGVALSVSWSVELSDPLTETWSWVLQLAEGSGSKGNDEIDGVSKACSVCGGTRGGDPLSVPDGSRG